MLSDAKRKFLFRCDDCQIILAVEFDEEEDLKKIQDNEMVLECPCNGICKILRD